MQNTFVDMLGLNSGTGQQALPYQLQLAQIQRQQRLADLLQQQVQQPIDVQQGGGAPAPISWGSVLAKALQGISGSMREGRANDQLQKLGAMDNDTAAALVKQLTQGTPQLGTAPMSPSNVAIDGTAPQISGGPAPAQQAPSQLPIPGTPGSGPTMGAPDSNSQLAALLAARGGPQTQMIQQAMLPQIMGRQNADYQHQLDRQDKTWENTLPMSTAMQQQIAAEGQQAQQNALFTNQLPMDAAQRAQLSKPVSVGFGQSLIDPRSGKVLYGGGSGGMTNPVDKNGVPVTGQAYLDTIPPTIRGMVKAIAEYRQAPLTATALRSPQGAQIAEAVNLYNPAYDATQYGSKAKARNAFATGTNGNTVRSLNVAIQHLDQLGQLSQALGNGDMQAVNKIGQEVAAQTGQPAPTNFNAAKQIVGAEIVKAIVGAGGGVGERETAAQSISAANSPQQLAGTIQTYKGLMAGQLAGQKQQYEKTTGLKDFEDYLSPATINELQAHAGTSASPASGKRLSPAEASKLPPNTAFIGTDGVPRRTHP